MIVFLSWKKRSSMFTTCVKLFKTELKSYLQRQLEEEIKYLRDRAIKDAELRALLENKVEICAVALVLAYLACTVCDAGANAGG